MADRFDVIVVGARCAGSPLATLLARAGLKVAVVERAAFPKDTLSTHIFQAPAINFLKRLEVFDRLLDTGARTYTRVDLRQEGFRCTFDVDQRPGDDGAFMSVRRFLLDPILRDAAVEAGAEVLMSTRVTGLRRDGGRVTGVTAVSEGEERALAAKLVVGADGRNSTVAELAGARKYNVVPGERFGYWRFFADADPGPVPGLVYHRWEGRLVISLPSDNGLYLVVVLPAMSFLPEFREDREAAFMAQARSCAPVADALAGASPVGKMVGMLKFECFFCESAGPGWALVGDAGHFKDPAPGQGIGDAFRQAEAMAPVIVGSINDSDDGAGRCAQGLGAVARPRCCRASLARHRLRSGQADAVGGGRGHTPALRAGSHRRAGECVPASQQAVGGFYASGRCQGRGRSDAYARRRPCADRARGPRADRDRQPAPSAEPQTRVRPGRGASRCWGDRGA